MLALVSLESPPRQETIEGLQRGVRWLLDLQNRDGGWPTFCRGWGTLPFDRSAPDITAHVLRALGERFEAAYGTPPRAGLKLGSQGLGLAAWPVYRAIERGFAYLTRTQRSDGSWLPLWFGNQHAPDDENPTYGTARVLAAWRDCGRINERPATRGLQWLRVSQNLDGGFGGGPGIPSGNEESALAAEVLLSLETPGTALSDGSLRALEWLLDRMDHGKLMEPSPIGFYFAKLWYFEKLYPMVFAVAALRRAVELLK
jgi:squalene-hopene/tetraprenyl-beta-curcumene cyclase